MAQKQPTSFVVAKSPVSKAARLDGDSIPAGPAGNALRESALWVLGALALIMLVALFSYDPRDPGFSNTGSGLSVHNQIGSGGAWFADLAYSFFGGPAYLLPAMTALAGWLVFTMRKLPGPLDRAILGTRLAGFLLTLLTSCGLATLHFGAGSLPQSAGGALGELVGRGLAGSLGSIGATLLLLSLWLAGVSIFSGLSWLALMDTIGRLVLEGVDRLRGFSRQLRERADMKQAQEQRQEVVRAERKKVAKKPPPRIEPVVKPPEPGVRVQQERQVRMFEQTMPGELPPLSLLDDPPQQATGYSTEGLQAMSRLVEMKLRDFGVEVEVVSVHPGPVVTRFELNPAPGVKVSQISGLAKDLARSLSAVSVRVVEVIPGKSTVGLEIPNETRELVTLGEILRSKAYEEMNSPLTLALGKDIGGKSVVADLQRMPHLLIAGTTGSGKSVGINAMVLSLVYKAKPEEVRLIMVDPKMLELSVYQGIPHLLCPVVTDMKDAANALRWCVVEMDRRYRLMAALGVRNIAGYNRRIRSAQEKGESIPDPFPPNTADGVPAKAEPLQPMPFIVIIIDELADMMMIVGKKVEELIARLAQKARAAGIHMIVATQRPSVDVITGLIKANIPCRIAFQVSAKVDSRTILDQGGAESLLGHGDMLFMAPGTAAPLRVHGAFVSDQEVHRVAGQLKGSGSPQYLDEVLEGPSTPIPGLSGEPAAGGEDGNGEADPLYDQAVQIVAETRRASVSGIQRRLKIGYNRAARLVETMEQAGLVGPLQSNGFREVLAPPPPEA
ncbi:MAG: DNA translocase FtsK [Proteobacteria bacterium]|nr:MAG: DNA translocase FtsK [Pseudomonadota bacterium]MBC6944081.1 DNA translocase FtsK [Gammaproteobacteria bacterium]MCE7897218.1 DNA translocase FtsK [Gammaproteobacteria bacterium PRO8]MDL1880399.1 cell division protein FtsK [Gammaproteobacteria bacterium PRO2]MCL4775973.1 DNA translocase FtsK 4TM domain-containing protein [Gammaproteobacteria bacterium]